jgi:16S rRNA G966 N2-methylase RsmD
MPIENMLRTVEFRKFAYYIFFFGIILPPRMKLKPSINAKFAWQENAQQWFEEHQYATDFVALRLKKNIPAAWIEHLQGKQQVKDKLPSFVKNPLVRFPPSLNLEQSSSERCAIYKASLFKGESFLDMTTGFGIDSFYLAKNFNTAVLIEQNMNLAELVAHNFAVLGCFHVDIEAGEDSISFLKNNHQTFSLIYLDPARRNETGKKTIQFVDCEPDISLHLNLLFQHSDCILLKASPMHDIEQALKELQYLVQEIHIVSLANECKELLFVLRNEINNNPILHAVHLMEHEQSVFSFYKNEELNCVINYSEPQLFLFEPNSSLLKAGAFKSVAANLGLHKLHQHSHLYTANDAMPYFPGRRFSIEGISKVDKKSIHQFLPDGKANITLRNFPSTVADLRKKLDIKDGGEVYIFATTLHDNSKVLIVCKKVN